MEEVEDLALKARTAASALRRWSAGSGGRNSDPVLPVAQYLWWGV